MAEPPPAKRAKRESSSAMWDKQDPNIGSTAPPRSERPHEPTTNGSHRREDDRRRRSRSPRDRDRDKHERNRRERSRSRERPSHRDRDQDRERGPRDRRERDRKRSRSRSRDRDRHVKQRSRSRSPARNGTSASTKQRSPASSHRNEPYSRSKHNPQDTRSLKQESGSGGRPNGSIREDQMDMDPDDEDALLSKVMGFSAFKTTQNTKVPGNQIYGVRKEKKTEYRQYMNRLGGFNRPLSPGR